MIELVVGMVALGLIILLGILILWLDDTYGDGFSVMILIFFGTSYIVGSLILSCFK